MANHPNRSRQTKSRYANPSKEEIRTAREAVGLTQTEAADLVLSSLNAWHQWEGGLRRMHPAFWELFIIKTAQLDHAPSNSI